MALRSNVRQFRERNQLRQDELADAVQVSRQTIIAVEKNGYTPSTELALRLARVLGATVEDLFTLED
ncbi:MAG: helix-turn-helix transcriptional regulator [Gemmatimonadota bacterium]|nr:MAG: helix-turn-helix transcriptional regulator [Gemmatimonadota bacterium]